VVVCGKLLKVLHGICTKHKVFGAQRMMRDITSLVEAVKGPTANLNIIGTTTFLEGGL